MSFFKSLFGSKKEPQTTSLTSQMGQRSRSGSFSGKLDLIGSDDHESKGYVKYSYSGTHRDLFVDTIVSDVKGGGTKLHQALDDIALHHTEARRMVTATSRPGYFKKMGYDYTDVQKRINAIKYTSEELHQQEQNRDESGGGFELEKRIIR